MFNRISRSSKYRPLWSACVRVRYLMPSFEVIDLDILSGREFFKNCISVQFFFHLNHCYKDLNGKFSKKTSNIEGRTLSKFVSFFINLLVTYGYRFAPQNWTNKLLKLFQCFIVGTGLLMANGNFDIWLSLYILSIYTVYECCYLQ